MCEVYHHKWYPRLALATVTSLVLSLFSPAIATEAAPLRWSTGQSAQSVCVNGEARINVSFTNNDGRSMDVTATDLQTGGSVNLGTVPPGQTVPGQISTGQSSLSAGQVRFDLTWSPEEKPKLDPAEATLEITPTDKVAPSETPTEAPPVTDAPELAPSETPIPSVTEEPDEPEETLIPAETPVPDPTEIISEDNESAENDADEQEEVEEPEAGSDNGHEGNHEGRGHDGSEEENNGKRHGSENDNNGTHADDERREDDRDNNRDKEKEDETASAILNFLSIGVIAEADSSDAKFAGYEPIDCPPPVPTPEHKIEICHATGSETNPWVQISVDENAWPAHEAHGDFKLDADGDGVNENACPPPMPTPEPKPECSLSVEITDAAAFWVQTSGSYGHTNDWGATLKWGHDGAEVSFPGFEGSFSESHQYPGPGTYDPALVVTGPGGSNTCSGSVTFQPPPEPEEPSCTLSLSVVNADTHEVKATGSYGKANDWGAILWWDEKDQENNEQFVAFPGVDGTFETPHQYADPGTYHPYLEVTGPGGTTTCTGEVTFEAPPQPTPEPKPEVVVAAQAALPPLTPCLTEETVVVERGGEILRLDLDLSKLLIVRETNLTAELDGASTHPSISPDGCRVVFSHTIPDTSQAELWTVGLNGIGLYQVTETSDISEVEPDWARDWVIHYSAGGHLFATDRLNTFVRDLRVEGITPDASPDGEWVAYTDPNGNIRIVSAHTARLGDFATGITGTNPTFDPQGDALYFGTAEGLQSLEFATAVVKTVNQEATEIARDPGNQMAILVTNGELSVIDPIEVGTAIGTLTGPQDTGFRAMTAEAPTLSPDWWVPNPVHPDTTSLQLFLISPAHG